jgi:hypothetical protein
MSACTDTESVEDYAGVRVGVRADAPPFSETSDGGQTYQGYMIDLCAEFLRDEIGTRFCARRVSPSGAGDVQRFEALEKGRIDMLCGATTATLAVSHRFRTSLTVFLSASAFLHVPRPADDTMIRIGYRDGSTSDMRWMADQPTAQDAETTIRTAILDRLGVPGAQVAFEALGGHDEAMGCLLEGGACAGARIDAYVGDRPILRAMLERAQADGPAGRVVLDETALVLQPYSVVFPKEPRGDRPVQRDLAFKFDRFLVTEKFNAQERRGGSQFLDFRRQLLRHFGSEVDVSYLRLAEMQGWIPVGDID